MATAFTPSAMVHLRLRHTHPCHGCGCLHSQSIKSQTLNFHIIYRYDKENVKIVSNKLEGEANEWWEDIQIDRKCRGKHSICTRQRTKKMLVDLWFSHDYYDILDYTGADYKFVH